MGNASSTVKGRVPRTLRKAKSFRERSKKHEALDKRNEEVVTAAGKHHEKSENDKTTDRSTMFVGYDSDAEVLDSKEILSEDANKATTDSILSHMRGKHTRGKLEGEIICWNKSPTLV